MLLKILQNLQENICARPAKSLKKQGLAQVFYCEFCKTFKNTFPTEHLLESAIEARKKKKEIIWGSNPGFDKNLEAHWNLGIRMQIQTFLSQNFYALKTF